MPAFVLLGVAMVNRLAFQDVAAGSSLTSAELRSGATWETVWYRSIFLQGDLLALGMIACVAVVVCRGADHSRARTVRTAAAASICAGTVGMVLARDTDWMAPMIGLACLGLLVVVHMPHPSRSVRLLLRALESRPLKHTGLCSYSIYLWHFPVIWFLRMHVERAVYTSWPGLAVTMVMVATLTIVLATITYRFVELPAMSRKRSTTQPPAPISGSGRTP